VLMTLYAFYHSRAGRPLISEQLLDR